MLWVQGDSAAEVPIPKTMHRCERWRPQAPCVRKEGDGAERSPPMSVKHTITLALALFLSLSALSVVAEAGKGGPHLSAGSGFALVLVNSTDGLPHWGQQVTFTVSTTATTEPHVSLQCSQAGTLVYSTQTGYFAGYLWPWTQTMTLASTAWKGGQADCVATLYYFDGSKVPTLGTLPFHVYP